MTTEGPSAVAKRSLSVAGHRTSVSLEEAFWRGLREASASRGLAVAALVAEVDRGRGAANLSSALRVHVLEFYRSRADMTVETGMDGNPLGRERR